MNNYAEYKPLKSMKDEDMKKLVRYPTIKMANEVIERVRRNLVELGKRSIFDSAQFTPLQINIKNVESNTKG